MIDSDSVVKNLLTKAFSTGNFSVPSKFSIWNVATAFSTIFYESKVPRFNVNVEVVMFRVFTSSSLMAQTFAPLSRSAYAGLAPDSLFTFIGTIGRVALWPAYAPWSHAFALHSIAWCSPPHFVHVI